MTGYTPQSRSLVSKNDTQSGFTLVEMIVAFSIFIIITSVVLFRGRTSQRQVQIRGVAYDVAYIIQKVQVLGRAAIATGANEGSQTYGVRFRYSGGVMDTIQVYKDQDGTAMGSPATFSNTDAIVDSFRIPPSITIQLCSVFSYGTITPKTAPGCTTVYPVSGTITEALVESRRLSQDVSDVVLDSAFSPTVTGPAFAIKISSTNDPTVVRYVVVGKTGFVSLF